MVSLAEHLQNVVSRPTEFPNQEDFSWCFCTAPRHPVSLPASAGHCKRPGYTTTTHPDLAGTRHGKRPATRLHHDPSFPNLLLLCTPSWRCGATFAGPPDLFPTTDNSSQMKTLMTPSSFSFSYTCFSILQKMSNPQPT